MLNDRQLFDIGLEPLDLIEQQRQLRATRRIWLPAARRRTRQTTSR